MGNVAVSPYVLLFDGVGHGWGFLYIVRAISISLGEKNSIRIHENSGGPPILPAASAVRGCLADTPATRNAMIGCLIDALSHQFIDYNAPLDADSYDKKRNLKGGDHSFVYERLDGGNLAVSLRLPAPLRRGAAYTRNHYASPPVGPSSVHFHVKKGSCNIAVALFLLYQLLYSQPRTSGKMTPPTAFPRVMTTRRSRVSTLHSPATEK